MTTYLLHGGGLSTPHSGNDNFFAQFTQLVSKDEVTILLCYFARERSEWQTLIERDTSYLKKNTTKLVKILIAENTEDLFAKLEKADVLYVSGGDAEPLEVLYQELADLRFKLDGKIYAGSSMGAFLAAENYVLSMDDQADDEVHVGVGLLPVQILCHWNVETKKEFKLELLGNYSPLPTIALNEFEFVTIYKNTKI